MQRHKTVQLSEGAREAGHARGIHTAYVGRPDAETNPAGKQKAHVSAAFIRGRGDGVHPDTRELLKKHGIIR